MNIPLAIAFVGVLVFMAHLFTGVFSRTRIPDILLLVFIGVLLGPVLEVVKPDHLGSVGPVFAQIALALILFEGGQDSRLNIIKQNWSRSLALIVVAFFLTMFVTGYLVNSFTDLGWNRSLMLGAILGNTSSAIVIPLVRQLRMESGPGFILMLESALTDVLCIICFLGLLEAHKLGIVEVGPMVSTMFLTFGAAALLGVFAGIMWSMFLQRLRSLQNNIFMTLALVFILYGLTEAVGIPGAVVVLFFGMGMANVGELPIPLIPRGIFGAPVAFTGREMAFFSEVIFLIKTFFFVYMGLSLQFGDFWIMACAIALVVLTLVLRIPTVWLTMPRSFNKRDASLMSIMAPKGLAAAVLASIPFQIGIEGGELIRDLVFSAILFSIILNSLFIFLLDKTPFGRSFASLFMGFMPWPLKGAFENLGEIPVQALTIPRNLDEVSKLD